MSDKMVDQFNDLDKALTGLGESDSTVEYAPHVREEFDKVIAKLNEVKKCVGLVSLIRNSDSYF